MNNTQLGNAACLMNLDLAELLCRSFSLSLVHIEMLTGDRPIKHGDKNRLNYRLGTANKEMMPLMQMLAGSEQRSVESIWHYLSQAQIEVRTMAKPNFGRKGRPVGTAFPSFSQENRGDYFVQAEKIVKNGEGNLVLLTPDVGLILKKTAKTSRNDSSTLTLNELAILKEAISEKDIIMVSQRMSDVTFPFERQLLNLAESTELTVLGICDEVLQAGAYFIVSNPQLMEGLKARLLHHLVGYLNMKKSQRILIGYTEAGTAIIHSVGSFTAPSASNY